MIAFVKTLILWAEMVGGCIGETATTEIAFTMEASAPEPSTQRRVVMTASVETLVDDDTVDCLSVGLAEMGW